MKFIILAALCSSVTCSTPNKDEADRREGISYSTSVVHSDPNFPDQQAQSSIDFKLETPDYKPKHPRNGFHHSSKEPSKTGYYNEQSKSVFHGSFNEPGKSVYHGSLNEPAKSVYHGNLNEPSKSVFHVNLNEPVKSGGHYSSFSGNGPPPGDKYYSSSKNVQSGDKYYQAQKDFWPQSSQKSTFRYNQPEIPKGMYPQIYTHPQFAAKPNSKPISTQFPSTSINKPVASSFPSNSQSQSFNVGYSVKFGGGNGNGNGNGGKPYKAPRLESDVITGSRKEEVNNPLDEYSLLDIKKHKISGIKYSKSVSTGVTPSQILSQSHITPKTQKQLAFLETIKGANKFQKEIEQAGANAKNNSPWKSLSPSVEIYKSREVSLGLDYPVYGSQKTKSGYFDNQKGYFDQQKANSDKFDDIKVSSGHFDHQRALGKSEGFDYTNAVDFSGLSASNVHQFMQPTVYDKQMNKQVTVQGNQYTSANQLYSFANQPNLNSVKPQQQGLAIPNLNSANSQQLSFNSANSQKLNFNSANSQQSNFNLASSQQQLGISNFNTGNPQALTVSNLNSVKPQIPKLPMDTSLLRDPILTVDKHNLKPDSSKIPIHFDTTLIQEIGKSYGALYNEAQGGFDVKEIQLSDKGYRPQDSEKEGSKVVQNYEQTLNDQEVLPNAKPGFEGGNNYKNNQFDQSAYQSQAESVFNAKPDQFGNDYNQKTQQFGNDYQSEQNGYNTKTNQFGNEQNSYNQFGSDQNQFGGEQNTYNKYGSDPKQKTNQFEDFNQQFENDASSEMKFSFPQNGLFNPSLQKIPKSSPKKTGGEHYRLRKPNMYMVKEPVEEAAQQPPSQFKVFSKPTNTFMRHEYEKFQKTRTPEKPRQPRINPKRIIRDYNLETDLKPPPLHYNRPRRLQKYETH